MTKAHHSQYLLFCIPPKVPGFLQKPVFGFYPSFIQILISVDGGIFFAEEANRAALKGLWGQEGALSVRGSVHMGCSLPLPF